MLLLDIESSRFYVLYI